MKLKKTELLDMKIIDWLFVRDPFIRWQVVRDILRKKEELFEIEKNQYRLLRLKSFFNARL